MVRILAVVVAFVVAIGLTLVFPAVNAEQGDAKAGQALYAKKCASCHGANGEGKPALAKALKVELRDLGSKEVQAKKDAELKKDTVEGIGKMKGVTGLSDKDASDLIAFMRSLAKK